MGSDESSEVLFLRRYKDAIMHFNMLERNIALCLRWASKRPREEGLLARMLEMPFNEKLRKLRSLIQKAAKGAEYATFLTMAEQCRQDRNKLVHGYWEYRWFLDEPIRYHVPSPFDEDGAMTQETFSTWVGTFEEAGALFNKLRQLHPLESLESGD